MIKNASKSLLNSESGTLPNVSGALKNWFQKITFVKIDSQIIDYKKVEVKTPISFKGVMQPMKPQEVSFRPEGERVWRWHTLHTEVGVEIKVNDVILFNEVRYRVKDKSNFSAYGYLKYSLVEDYDENP